MKHNEDFFNWLYSNLKIWSSFVAYNLIGIAANYADHYRKGTLTKKQAIVSGVMGIVTGYLAFQLCIHFKLNSQMGLIIPAATMLGERVIPYIMDNGFGLLIKWVNKKSGGKDELPG